MPIRGVLFDVDDTLFDYSSSEETGLVAHLRAEKLLDPATDPAAAVALWREVLVVEYARFLAGELSFPEQQLSRTRKFLSRWRDGAAGALSDRDAAAWFAGYETHRRAAWSAFPDAEPALRALAANFGLGIVSNSALAAQRRKLEAVGLLPYFGDVFICSAEYGAAKPASSIFHAGCASLGLPPEQVAHVGDVYAVDAVGAQDAGLHAFWLDRHGSRADMAVRPGIRVVDSLAEFAVAVEWVAGSGEAARDARAHR